MPAPATMQSGPFAPSGTLSTLEMSPAGAGLSDARFDFSGPYSGTGLPAALASFVYGVGETLVPSVAITNATVAGDGTATITTASNHGIPVGEVVSPTGTGLLIDGGAYAVTGATANSVTFAFVGDYATSSTGTLIFEFPRLSAWGSGVQATLANMPKKASTGIVYDVSDIMTFGPLTTGAEWTLIWDSTYPSSVGANFAYGSATNYVNQANNWSMVLRTAAGTFNLGFPNPVGRILYMLVVSATNIKLYRNGVLLTTVASAAGPIALSSSFSSGVVRATYLRLQNGVMTPAQLNAIGTERAALNYPTFTWTPIV